MQAAAGHRIGIQIIKKYICHGDKLAPEGYQKQEFSTNEVIRFPYQKKHSSRSVEDGIKGRKPEDNRNDPKRQKRWYRYLKGRISRIQYSVRWEREGGRLQKGQVQEQVPRCLGPTGQMVLPFTKTKHMREGHANRVVGRSKAKIVLDIQDIQYRTEYMKSKSLMLLQFPSIFLYAKLSSGDR